LRPEPSPVFFDDFELEPQLLEGASEYLKEWFAPRALEELLFYHSIIPEYQYQEVLMVILSRSARSARLIPHYDLARPKEPVRETYWCIKHKRYCQPTKQALKFINRYSYDTVSRIKKFHRIMNSTDTLMSFLIFPVKMSWKLGLVFGEQAKGRRKNINPGLFGYLKIFHFILYRKQKFLLSPMINIICILKLAKVLDIN